MDQTFLMSLNNILGKKESLGDILADFSRHIVSLNRINDGILVGILLLNLFVVALKEA